MCVSAAVELMEDGAMLEGGVPGAGALLEERVPGEGAQPVGADSQGFSSICECNSSCV